MTSHDDLEDRLIWILGSPRTGSTWLLRMLIHPLALARNPLGFAAPRLRARIPAMPVVPLNEPYLPVHLTPLRIPPRQREGDPDASKFLVNSQREEDASYFFSREYEWAWRPELRRLVLARFAAQVDAAVAARRLPTPLVAVKEPNGSHGAELLMSLFPRSRLIFLMRDGRDVLNSLLESQLPGGWREGVGRPIDSGGRRLEFVTTHSRLWVQRMNAVGSAFDRHPPDRRLRLRYEDLIVDAEGRMRQLFTWLGAEPRSGQVEGAIDATAKRRP